MGSEPEDLASVEKHQQPGRAFTESLIEVAQAMVLQLDADGLIVRINPFMERISGYAQEEVAGRDLISTFLPDRDRVRARTRLSGIFDGTVKSGSVYPIVLKDGTERIIKWHSRTLEDGSGHTTGLVSMGIDVTDEVLSREDVRRTEVSYRSLIELLPDAVVHIDLEGRILIANKQALRLYGMEDSDRIVGMTFMQLIAPEDHERAAANFRRRLDGESLDDTRYTITTADGRPRQALVRATLVTDEEGGPISVIAVIRDVTDSAQDERMAELHQQRLRALTTRLTLIEEKERRAIASELHDSVGQTLAVASMRLGQIGRDAPAEIQDQLAEVKELWEQAMRYTRSLVAELSPPVLHELGLEAALDWLVERQNRFSEYTSSFEDDGLPKPMHEDVSILLFQCARELLVNASKHAGASSVKVSIRRGDAGIVITVADDGKGFDPSATGADDGFGLFAIRERLEIIGGTMKLDSSPGRGSRITLAVPLEEAPATGGKT